VDIQIKLAWLAGIIEGEGCFSINQAGKDRNYFVYCISITNTDSVLLNQCSEILKEINVDNRVVRRNIQIENRRTRYDLKVEGIDKLILTINAIMPYIFGQKKAQAELMLNFLLRRKKVIGFYQGKSPRRRAYDSVDQAFLNAMKELKSATEPVETERSLSLADKVTVRTACINEDAEIGRNDLFANLF